MTATRSGSLKRGLAPPTLDASDLVPTTAWVAQNTGSILLPATAGAVLVANRLVTASGSASNPSLTTADNTIAGAAGFVLAASASGAAATLVRAGPLSGLSGLSPGVLYYLGTSGSVTATPPTASGTIVQVIGIASSTSTIDVRLGEPEINE